MKQRIVFSILLCSVLVLLGSCTISDSETKEDGNTDTASQNDSISDSALTALQAWEIVKPEVVKWDPDYKMAKVSDASPAGQQRIDGLGAGWEFYVGVCTEESTAFGGTCLKGKSRSFYWYGVDMVGADKGVSADSETPFPSGRTDFDIEAVKIDSDEAEDLARQAEGQDRDDSEEFILSLQASGDVTYWEVRRQCWIRGEDDCDSQAGYTQYIDAISGEAYDSKPQVD